jgi:hypothetical protein
MSRQRLHNEPGQSPRTDPIFVLMDLAVTSSTHRAPHEGDVSGASSTAGRRTYRLSAYATCHLPLALARDQWPEDQ